MPARPEQQHPRARLISPAGRVKAFGSGAGNFSLFFFLDFFLAQFVAACMCPVVDADGGTAAEISFSPAVAGEATKQRPSPRNIRRAGVSGLCRCTQRKQ